MFAEDVLRGNDMFVIIESIECSHNVDNVAKRVANSINTGAVYCSCMFSFAKLISFHCILDEYDEENGVIVFRSSASFSLCLIYEHKLN